MTILLRACPLFGVQFRADINGKCVVTIDLEKLNEVLEKEGIKIDVDYVLSDYIHIGFLGYKLGISFFPARGVHSGFHKQVAVYIKRSGLCWRVFSDNLANLLNRENIVCTLAHEIKHAIDYKRLETAIKNKYLRNFIYSTLCFLNLLIYPISFSERSARNFWRHRKIDPNWLDCVEVKN